MEHVLDAIYSDGVLKPLGELDLPENQRVRITISVPDAEDVERSLQAWHQVYAGLSAEEIAAVEQVALDRAHFMNGQQEAKQKFSELVPRALDEGPQIMTRHGEEVVVVLSAREFRRLSGSTPDFKEFLLSGPDLSQLDLERAKDPPRDIEL